MFRRALLSGLVIIAGGLSTVLGGGTAIAGTPAQACAVTSVIEITHFAFNPPAIPPGQSSTATLTAQNCTNQVQQTSEIWSGRFANSSGSIPPGCPAIDPISFGVNSGFEGVTPGPHGTQESLATWLRSYDIRSVDVVGIATDYCVLQTALDAVSEGFHTRVLLDLTAGVAADSTTHAMDQLRSAGVHLSGRPVVRG